MEDKQKEATSEELLAELKKTTVGLPVTNIPLTDSQKIIIKGFQNRIQQVVIQETQLEVQKTKLEAGLQLELMKIGHANNIDLDNLALNENLDLVPKNPNNGPQPAQITPKKAQ
jgi:hypothetical protein